MNEFLIIFIGLSIVNVIFSTVRSIVTIKGGKIIASLFSGGYFAFYNVMMLYTVADFPMWQKCIITFVCNVIGVFLVKWGEEKARKDKLWKVEATVLRGYTQALRSELDKADIPHNYLENVGPYTLFNIYCSTQKQSVKAREIMAQYNAKYFVSESKTL